MPDDARKTLQENVAAQNAVRAAMRQERDRIAQEREKQREAEAKAQSETSETSG